MAQPSPISEDTCKNQGMDSGDVYKQMKVVEEARQALLNRKRFSVRNQIYIVYAIVFLFALGVAVFLISNIYQIQSRLQFMETVNDFSSEIQQARRYEKNFFLYGTNLDDALENVRLARDIMNNNVEQVASVLGRESMQTTRRHLDAYTDLLERMKGLQRDNPVVLSDKEYLRKIEKELRHYGNSMVTLAQGFMEKEKAALSKSLKHSIDIHISSLVVLLIFLAVNAYLLVSRIFSNLKRFTEYAQRIAAGDFSPITPKRRFRDEFTELAIAINEMEREIVNRESALIQAHKLKAVGTLTAGVAHELNNPINNIMLTVYMLMEDNATLLENERLEMLQDAAEETGRAKNIVANLLDFAREGASTIEVLDLEKILKNTIHLAGNQIRMSDVAIELQMTENLPPIHGDGQKLQQVLLNLILNAADASPRGSKIQVIALPHGKGDQVAVKVIDYGKGIPRHILASIFDPFFTTKAKGKGTGLGLSVSQGIVAKHGGKILVDSEEGSGSVFTVVLPVTTLPKNIPLF